MAVRGYDAFQNHLTTGGAVLAATLHTSTGAAEQQSARAAEVRDRGDGVYEVDCSSNAACDFEVPKRNLLCFCLARRPKLMVCIGHWCSQDVLNHMPAWKQSACTGYGIW